jgi:hypothetical protein
MFKSLLNIRLTYIYPILFVIFMVVLSYLQPAKLTTGQLALYSTNTFLFGFYFLPLLSSQKTRIDNLSTTLRSEATTILDILAQLHLLKPALRHEIKVRLKVYLDSIYKNTAISADNAYYDDLLRFTREDRFKGDPVMETIYTRVSKTQENRDTLNRYLTTGVFSHEWLVALVLFFITIYFVMQTNYDGVFFFRMLLAILCTGITLMLIILIKYATLTHKYAKRMWLPLLYLMKGHFDDIEPAETAKMRQRIDAADAAEAA